MTRHAARAIAAAALLAGAITTCGGSSDDNTVRFWALGREGEVVQSLVPEFERRNPGIRVRVQQIPWTAAHEKLLTSFVGDATPDAAQLGNTWVPEFAALDALEQLDSPVQRSRTITPSAYFRGIWATNVVNGRTYGVPWYVDTRVLFYRKDLLARAGYSLPPTTWATWTEALRRVKALGEPTEYGVLLPLDEWNQPVIFGLQNGAPLLADGGRRGDFEEPRFREAFNFYIGLFRSGLAPTLSNTEISNVYQEFDRGRYGFYPSGPWNIGEFRRRLPAKDQDRWATMPLPGPTEATTGVSMAGGSSLVVFRQSTHKEAAWRFIEFLSEPAQQLRFYELTGDLPARREAWRAPEIANDPATHAFAVALERSVPLPQVPEWEEIAQRVSQYAEQAARGRLTVDVALARLDHDVDGILAKRRWMLDRERRESMRGDSARRSAGGRS
jgi:multiple sugar transport system substrate-binding protein